MTAQYRIFVFTEHSSLFYVNKLPSAVQYSTVQYGRRFERHNRLSEAERRREDEQRAFERELARLSEKEVELGRVRERVHRLEQSLDERDLLVRRLRAQLTQTREVPSSLLSSSVQLLCLPPVPLLCALSLSTRSRCDRRVWRRPLAGSSPPSFARRAASANWSSRASCTRKCACTLQPTVQIEYMSA